MAALACIQWIRDELEAHGDLKTLSPPLLDTKSICEFVTDGRALCLLTNAVLEGEENELPKKLQRSLKQLSKFHALERVQFFIKWCRTRAKLEEHQVFTTVQLLDEVNETAVSETIVALRNKTRPGLKATNALAQYYFDGENNVNSNNAARVSTSSTTSSGSSSVNNASKLSSFLNKFPSAPRVSQSKPPMSHNRVSLTSSVASSNASPRDFEEPVPADEDNNNNKSRLRVPSIFKGNNSNSNNRNSYTSATPRSSIISNASSSASTSKEEGHEIRSRSWSSKLSAFSRSHSPMSNTSTPKTISGGDLDSSDTPPSSPPASPHNRVSIPRGFSTPASKAPKSSSKLSAFLSSVDTTSSVIPATKAPSQDKKMPEPAVESTPEEGTEPFSEDNQVEEQEQTAAIEMDVQAEEESMDMSLKAEKKLLKKPPSSAKLLAFLQTVGTSSSMTLPLSEEDEDDFVAVEADEAFSAEGESSAVEEEVAPFEEDAVESEASETEVKEDAAMAAKAPAPETHDEVAAEGQETSEEEVEAPEEETPEKLESVFSATEPSPLSTEVLEENERLVAVNASLTQKLEVAVTALSTKDTELEALKQEIDLLKTLLAKEQIKAQEAISEVEKKQEAVAADAAEARAELIKSHQSFTELASAAKEASEAEAQIKELTAQNESLTNDLFNLREEVQTLEQSVQLARDSEDAARYAAQVAFAARDSADEVNQQLKERLAQLEQ